MLTDSRAVIADSIVAEPGLTTHPPAYPRTPPNGNKVEMDRLMSVSDAYSDNFTYNQIGNMSRNRAIT